MEAKKRWNYKKIVAFCLLFLMTVFVMGAMSGCGCSRRVEETQTGKENVDGDESKEDDSELNEKEEIADETETDEPEEDEGDASDEDDAFYYEDFEGESEEDGGNGSEDGSLDDMKQYPTDPVVVDKDWGL